jgi:uncharacterized protein (DUF1778 family)
MKVIEMAKTITLRLADDLYTQIKNAAESEHRSIANFIENATQTYIMEEIFVSDEEMEDILRNKDFIRNLKSSLDDIEKGNYTIVE